MTLVVAGWRHPEYQLRCDSCEIVIPVDLPVSVFALMHKEREHQEQES